MTDDLILHNGDSEQGEFKTYWFITPVTQFPLPVLTDKYLINDIIYYVVGSWFPHLARGTPEEMFGDIDSSMWDTIDELLEHEDTHLLDTIVEAIRKKALEIINSPKFEHIKNSQYEIEKVEYRYERAEKFVKWHITIG